MDGKPCANSKVEVFGGEGELLLEGTTDGEGLFSFDVPARTDLKLVLYAGEGHRNEYVVKAGELSAGGGADDAPEGAGDVSAAGSKKRMDMPSPAQIVSGIGYIVGIMGLWMFYLSRKNRGRRDSA